MKKKRGLVFLILAGSLLLARFLGVGAQGAGPEFLVTWEAKTYVPPQFQGRTLPVVSSLVAASVEMINQDRIVDISKQDIYWYLNGDFLEGGQGLQRTSFLMNNTGAQRLEVKLPNYQGNVSKIIEIPVVKPEAVIAAPSSNNLIYGSTRVAALPYFFNVSSPAGLSYSWEVNGQTPASLENPEVLDINLSPETPNNFQLNIGLVVRNLKRVPERTTRVLNLFYVKNK